MTDFLRVRKFSDAHFTQQYAKTVHIHLEEKIKYHLIKSGSIYQSNYNCLKMVELLSATSINPKQTLLKRYLKSSFFSVNHIMSFLTRQKVLTTELKDTGGRENVAVIM